MRRSPRPEFRPLAVGLVVTILAMTPCFRGPSALAQDEKAAKKDEKKEDKKDDKAAGVFDDETPATKEKEKEKPKDEAKDKEKPKEDAKPKADAKAEPAKDKAADPKKDAPSRPADPNKPAPGGAVDRDTIGFTQENAASQMTELEERMFRLSEALRGLEPENASRLRLALKFSREELILEQMRETNKMLKEAQLSKAETEVKELLAKLEHLRDVLIAEDLDFQLKLARLRQIRETMSQLDRIVKDERRELGWSRFAIDQRKAREKLAARRPDLENLLRDQKALIADTKALADKGKSDDRKPAREALRDRQAGLGKAAAAMATNPLFAEFQASQLRKAEPLMNDARDDLGRDGDDLAPALASEEKAAAVLEEELKGLDARIAGAERDVAEAEFRRHEAGQQKTRRASESLGAASARLGDSGVSLQKDLIRAGGAMQSAEKSLSQTSPDPAASDQSAALDILTKTSEDLAKAAEKLLVQLRTELQQRLIGELTEMHEMQAAIRETTEAQAPRLAQKSRAAAIAVAALSQKEAELAGRTEQLLALVEETEFGIALPTALRLLSKEMRDVEGWLKDGDASAKTIAMELRIEEDILGLLQAIRRLPPTTPPRPGDPAPSEGREQERELNRLIAELKMIRLLQVRLNDDTTGVDKTRPAPSNLPPALRREIEALESTQEDLRESLSKIAERIEQQQP